VILRVLSGAAIVALTAVTSAFAADLAVKAPAYKAAAPVPFSWTGCFVGGHVGGAVSEDKTINAAGNSTSFSASGFVGGG
jgi:outer membrane immunogenic protein